MPTVKETITHFQCEYCQGWWSIVNIPAPKQNDWYCPWCGEIHMINKMPQYALINFRRDMENMFQNFKRSVKENEKNEEDE